MAIPDFTLDPPDEILKRGDALVPDPPAERLFQTPNFSQDEAMANADSATNMLWLINQATAGEISSQSQPAPAAPRPEEKSGEGALSAAPASFGSFKIDMNA